MRVPAFLILITYMGCLSTANADAACFTVWQSLTPDELREIIGRCNEEIPRISDPEEKAKALFRRGQFYRELNELDRAVTDYTAAIELYAAEYLFLARAQGLEKLGRGQDATRDWLRYLEFHPCNDEIRTKLKSQGVDPPPAPPEAECSKGGFSIRSGGCDGAPVC